MDAILPSASEMQRASSARDASYDGIFFLAVKSTGIFCRPSCPARKPKPENVVYLATVQEALFGGYRPCLRCRPLETDGRPPEWVAGLLSEVERDPAARLNDFELRQRGIEPTRVRRFFQKEYGMTFHAYRRARRLGSALELLRGGERPEDAGWDVGFESASGFRDAFARTFGTAPGGARDAECVRIAWVESPVGPLLLGGSAKGVALLEFTDRRALESQLGRLRKRVGGTLLPGTNEHVERAKVELSEYFAGRRSSFEVPLDAPGTPFETAVWNELVRIPYGETRSYQDLARRRAGERAQPDRDPHPLPPRGQQGRRARRLRWRALAQALPARSRAAPVGPRRGAVTAPRWAGSSLEAERVTRRSDSLCAP